MIPDPKPTPKMLGLHHETMVWILDKDKMYLKCVHSWRFNDDGTLELDGRKLQWFPAKEFTWGT